MKAAVLWGPGDLRVQEYDRPVPKDGEVLMRVRAAGICSSDIARIRVTGAYHHPLICGHEFAGETGGGRYAAYPMIPCGECEACRIGQAMCCTDYGYLGSRRDGAFAEYVAVPKSCLVPIPEGVDYDAAAMCEPASVGLHALRRGEIHRGDRVCVVGAGTIGIIIAQWARALGAREVALLDIADEKLGAARALGFDLCLNTREADPVEALGRFDLVVEAVGLSQTFNAAIDLACPAGRVVLMGNIAGDLTMPKARVSSILRKQLTVSGTWNSSLGGHYGNEWEQTLAALAGGRLQLKELISHRIGIEGIPAAIEMIAGGEPVMKVIVEM